MLPRWTAVYVINSNEKEEKTVEVFAETVFQAWYNSMCIIQILEKTEEYSIKSVNPTPSSYDK